MNALLAILNVFVNPAETVRRIRGNKLAWFPPVLLGGLIMAAYNYTLPHVTMQAMRNAPPDGITTAKLDEMMGTMQALTRFSTISAPMLFAVMTLIGAVLIFAACVVLTVNIKFPDLFNLMAHVGLINALQALTHLVILRRLSGAFTVKELAPNFGLEFLVPDGGSRLLMGLATFFSIFTVWHIVMLVIGFAALARIGKAKAFLVTSPSWLIGLISALIGALFR